MEQNSDFRRLVQLYESAGGPSEYFADEAFDETLVSHYRFLADALFFHLECLMDYMVFASFVHMIEHVCIAVYTAVMEPDLNDSDKCKRIELMLESYSIPRLVQHWNVIFGDQLSIADRESLVKQGCNVAFSLLFNADIFPSR